MPRPAISSADPHHVVDSNLDPAGKALAGS